MRQLGPVRPDPGVGADRAAGTGGAGFADRKARKVGSMKRNLVGWPAVLALTLTLTACGDDGSDNGEAGVGPNGGASAAAQSGGASGGDGDTSGAGGSGVVVDPASPGQATARVDGLELTFELPGALGCSISDDSITYSYRIGDNEVTLGAGFNRVDGGWMGSIDLSVRDPEGEPGPIGYYPAPGQQGVLEESLIAVDGQSMSYSGPMLKQPANDGSLPAPVDVGTGTVSATCA